MDSKIVEIKKKLEAQRQELLRDAGETINEGIKPDKENYADLTDQASVESDRSLLLRLRGREQRLLKKIDEAVKRIEDGTFGVCESCGEKIGIKRLQARPVTTLCIDCKTAQEEEEKLRK
jgi:DnaK suppressor protein